MTRHVHHSKLSVPEADHIPCEQRCDRGMYALIMYHKEYGVPICWEFVCAVYPQQWEQDFYRWLPQGYLKDTLGKKVFSNDRSQGLALLTEYYHPNKLNNVKMWEEIN